MKSNTHDIQEMNLYFLSAMHEPLNVCPLFILTSYQPGIVLSVQIHWQKQILILGTEYSHSIKKNFGTDFWWHSDAKGGFEPPQTPPNVRPWP